MGLGDTYRRWHELGGDQESALAKPPPRSLFGQGDDASPEEAPMDDQPYRTELIPEELAFGAQEVDGDHSALRLGRHIEHDPRSWSFPAERSSHLVTTLHVRHAPIFDQGALGSCTGNAMAGLLGTAPFQAHPGVTYDETLALALYEQGTHLDSVPGNYPPHDTGSSGLAVAKAAKQRGLIAGYAHAFGMPHALAALVLRPIIIGIPWYECLPDDQRVLTSDLRWVPIQKVQVGDELIGFDESIGRKGKMRRSVVTALGEKIRPIVEITTERGAVRTSTGHLFVRCHPKAAQEWVRADTISPGDRLAYFMDPFIEDQSWEAGWLAGFFDGEGTVSNGYQVNFGQVVGPTLDKAIRLLSGMGFETTIKQERPIGTDGGFVNGRQITSRKELHNIYVTGAYHGALRFLGSVRPERLLTHAHQLWEDRSTVSRRGSPVEVQEVRFCPPEPVHTIATSTGTLIVEGLLSHNSFDSPDLTKGGLISISAHAQVRGGHELEVVGLRIEDSTIRIANSWGPGWADQGYCTMTWTTFDRLLHEHGDVVTVY